MRFKSAKQTARDFKAAIKAEFPKLRLGRMSIPDENDDDDTPGSLRTTIGPVKADAHWSGNVRAVQTVAGQNDLLFVDGELTDVFRNLIVGWVPPVVDELEPEAPSDDPR